MPGNGRRCYKDDEGPCRAADLEPAAAERRDEKSADDRGIEPPVPAPAPMQWRWPWTMAAQQLPLSTGNQVGPEMGNAVAFTQNRDKFGREQSENPAAVWVVACVPATRTEDQECASCCISCKAFFRAMLSVHG